MFTGIVQAVGKIVSLQDHGEDRRVTLDVGDLDLTGVNVGDSICVSGVCLTVSSATDHHSRSFGGDTVADHVCGTKHR